MGTDNAVEVERLRAGLASLVLVADTIIPDGGDPQGDAERIADVMIAAGVWLPPADSTLTEGSVAVIQMDYPWAGRAISIESGFDGEMRVFEGEGLGVFDVTEAYRAHLASLPQINVRTYEWPEAPPTCPECAAGKHRVCSDLAEGRDGEPTTCRCPAPECQAWRDGAVI